MIKGFPCGSAGKESACNVRDLGSNPGLGRSPGKGKGYPLQYSGLENSMDCIVHGVAKSWTRLSDFHSVVKNLPASTGDIREASSIPGSGRLPWSRAWQPTPVFLPGESHGQRNLDDCRVGDN